MNEEKTEEIYALLGKLEVDKVGVASLDDLPGTEIREKATRLLPGASSIIVLALEVFQEVVSHIASRVWVGEMALRDLYLKNTELVGGLLNWEAYQLVKGLHNNGFKGLPLPDGGVFDERFLEGEISFKHVAQAAGLGIFDWHSMLIMPEYGSRVRFACVVTDAPLASTPVIEMGNPCIKCQGACVRVCPVRAIGKPEEGETYHVDKYACNTYYAGVGLCSECLKVCPAGREQQCGHEVLQNLMERALS
ncbi:MAG: epoxyqueuosine reductase [Dehalococcoidia bacterium]|nr:epoxyqueuosine reductase [Dehalococcoidia bacterium]